MKQSGVFFFESYAKCSFQDNDEMLTRTNRKQLVYMSGIQLAVIRCNVETGNMNQA